MKSLIAWFAGNGVVATLLMLLIVALGLMSVFTINQEVFPEFEAELITVSVPYRGAAPEEVEEGVVVRIEEAIEGLEGVKRITSTASENAGTVSIEVETGFDIRELLDNVKARVDAISTFPLETEEPVVQEVLIRMQVINVSIFGDTDERTLKQMGQEIRDELVALEGISQADLKSVRPYEIAIEVSEGTLRRYGLTFDDVASAVRRSSLDLPGGSVKAESGEVLLRTTGQAYTGEEYRDLALLTRPDGSRLRLGEVARVSDGFEETDQWARLDGQPTAMIQVYRVGDENAPDVSRTVRDYVERKAASLPDGISITTWQDTSVLLSDRTSLLVRNGFTGLILVFIVLTLFLRMRLAVWVALGIPVAFLGAIAVMPLFGLTINMMTLFAFILVLGIVVDDAIVVAERIHSRHESGFPGLKGAILGTQEVTVPVVFGVMTTMAAFTPFMMVPGMMGNFTRAIPLIVIPVLAFSLIESQLVLPYHLSHEDRRPRPDRSGVVGRMGGGIFSVVDRALDGFVERVYAPLLRTALRWRYLTASIGLALLMLTGGLIWGGIVEWVFFPDMDSDNVIVTLTMPEETPAEVTGRAVEGIERAALELGGELEQEFGQPLFRHVLASVGEQPSANMGPANPGLAPSRAYLGEVNIELVPGESRPTSAEWPRGLSSAQIGSRLREKLDPIPGAVELDVQTELMMGMGSPIDIQLAGPDIEELQVVAHEIRQLLEEYPGVFDVTDSFRRGKPEVELTIRPSAEALGLSLEDLGRQVRQGFFGEEAQRIQRGSDDIRVMVRYPAEDRQSVGDLDYMRIRTPSGDAVPFGSVADAELGRGFSSIRRVDRQRAINVTADVDDEVENAWDILSDLEDRQLPGLLARYPGVSYSFEGEQQMQDEFMGGLYQGFGIALFAIFALMAIPFRSYVQPIIVMSAIPFGLVGAVIGHALAGWELNFMSMMGMVAVSGVVVNDSLVLVHFVNQKHREENLPVVTAAQQAGIARFRPILLTSLTTAAGVTPLMLETSLQARFLIPMALALSSGVLFATVSTLFVVPSIYIILEDLKKLFGVGPEPAGVSGDAVEA